MTLQIWLYDRKTGIYLHELHENRRNKKYTAVIPQSGKSEFATPGNYSIDFFFKFITGIFM